MDSTKFLSPFASTIFREKQVGIEGVTSWLELLREGRVTNLISESASKTSHSLRASYLAMEKALASRTNFSAEEVIVWGEEALRDLKNAQQTRKEALEETGVLVSKFVKVPAGSFMMGSPPDEEGRDSDETQHEVKLTKGFEMQAHELTQLQFFRIAGFNPSYFSKEEHCKEEHIVIEGVGLCPNHPVESVSWDESQEYISKLNDLIDDGYRYRLPTEAEWEYAARAGGKIITAFNLGSNVSPDQVNYDGRHPYGSASTGIFRGQTIAVGSLPNANALGLHDMHGNVWEWVQDWYGAYPRCCVEDPQGPEAGTYRVYRGGGWYSVARGLRSANRSRWSPGKRYNHVGFRLVRTAR